jgi:hypothetical protein
VSDDADLERLWASRLRWRLRGATQWPALWAVSIVEAVVVHLLPPASDDGPDLLAAFLGCGILNLLVIAILGPAGGLLLRRRDPSLPRAIAADRAATLAILAGLVALLAAGIVHRPAVQDAHRTQQLQLDAARDHFGTNPQSIDVLQQAPDLYRDCVPGRDARHQRCVFVDLSSGRPVVRADPDQRPNETVAGPG